VNGVVAGGLSTLSQDEVVNWISELALSESLSSLTIRAYLTGLNYFFVQETLRADGPTSSVAVTLCMNGILRSAAAREKVARDAKPRDLDITTEILTDLRDRLNQVIMTLMIS